MEHYEIVEAIKNIKNNQTVFGNTRYTSEKLIKLLLIKNPDDYQTEYEFKCINNMEKTLDDLYDCFYDKEGNQLY